MATKKAPAKLSPGTDKSKKPNFAGFFEVSLGKDDQEKFAKEVNKLDLEKCLLGLTDNGYSISITMSSPDVTRCTITGGWETKNPGRCMSSTASTSPADAIRLAWFKQEWLTNWADWDYTEGGDKYT